MNKYIIVFTLWKFKMCDFEITGARINVYDIFHPKNKVLIVKTS